VTGRALIVAGLLGMLTVLLTLLVRVSYGGATPPGWCLWVGAVSVVAFVAGVLLDDRR
jgi:hypothetical protein